MQMINLEFEKLQAQCKAAWQFMKSTSLMENPWYLIIGPTGAGKSQLILHAGLKSIPAPHLTIYPADEDENQHRCNWWYTSKATFLDIPGNYLLNNAIPSWQQLLAILSPYFKRKPLAGVILTIALPEQWQQTKSEQTALAHHLRETLYLLSKQLKIACPLYFVLTKADQINGFTEFFTDLGQEERNQPWGFHLSRTTTTSLPRLFKNQFDQLLKRLNTRLIWRLHQERHLQKRALICQFPLQLETLKNGLANLIYQLTDVIAFDQLLPLQGIYFTSSLQQGSRTDYLHKTLTETMALTPPLVFPSVFFNQQSYFTQQLFEKILSPSVLHLARKKEVGYKMRLGIYICAVGLVMSSSLLMARDFNTKITELNAAKLALTQYKIITQQLPTNDRDLSQTLPALNRMQQTNDLLQQIHLPWLFTAERTLSPLAAKTYQLALDNYFLPGLANLLEQGLMRSTDPNFLYGALKVYLMLGDPNHLDAAFVQNWLTDYWQQTLNGDPILETQMEKHLTALLAQPIIPVVLNETIIAKTRAVLNEIPKPLLAYAILKSQTDDTLIDPFAQTTKQIQLFNQVFSHNKPLLIPHFYTANAFSTIYFLQTQKAATAASEGDWVLGIQTKGPVTVGLTDQVKLLYLRDYTQQWIALLNNLQIMPWQNWPQAQSALRILSHNDSPAIKALEVVVANTTLKSLIPTTTWATAHDRDTIKNNLSNNFIGVVNSLQSISIFSTASTQLQNYLRPINGNAEKAFHASKSRFTNTTEIDPIETTLSIAKTLPQPLQNWLATVANNNWKLILATTDDYLNQTWHTQVFSYYQAYLADRYPLSKTASADIELNKFMRFFAPHQILDDYFKNYLAPFIDTSQTQWHWRSLDDQTLNLSPVLLTQLERAAIIRTMFFDDQDKFIVPFILRPIAMGPNVARVTLQINDQHFSDQPTAASDHNIFWPNTSSASSMTFTITDNQGQRWMNVAQGPWALFRLLDKAKLQAGNNTQNYLLTFDLNGNLVRYQLSTNKLINPFIPGIIDQFRCPTLP